MQKPNRITANDFRWLCTAIFLLATYELAAIPVGTLSADEPTVDYIFPAGGQRGTKVEFHVGGNNLHSRADFEMIGLNVTAVDEIRPAEKTVWFDGPLLRQPFSSRKEDYPKDYDGSVEIGSSAKPGVRRWRVSTSQGITKSRPFVIGDFPEVIELEADGTPIPVEVQLPTTINGRIFPREDIDIWTFPGKKGETYSCDVHAARIESPLDSRLEIRDPDGRLVAENTDFYGTDSLCGFTADKDGTYSVYIHDVNYDGMQNFVYRLTIRQGPYVASVFPLGGKAGSSSKFTADGFGLSKTTFDLPLSERPSGVSRLTATIAGKTTNPFRIAVSEHPEYTEGLNETKAIQGPAVLNGQIEKPGETDRWVIIGTKDQQLSVFVQASGLGSHLDAVVTIFDAEGKQIATADDSNGSTDAAVSFKPTADGEYVVAVSDRFESRGGRQFAYRMTVEPPAVADFQLDLPYDAVTIIQGETTKLIVNPKLFGGFQEEIALRIDGLPTGVTFAPDKLAKGKAAEQITFTASAEALAGKYQLEIRGTATIDGTEVTRNAKQQVEGGGDGLALAVAVPTPFKVVGIFETKFAARGATFVRRYSLERNGYEGPLTIKLADRQVRHLQGVTGATIVVPAGQTEFEYHIQMATEMELARTSRTCVMAVGEVTDAAGEKHTVSYTSHQQNDQIIILTDPEQFVLQVDQPILLAKAGSEIDVSFQAGRGAGFDQPIEVQLLLPTHIRGVTADPVKLDKTSSAAKMKLRFNDAPGPFNKPLTIRATTYRHGLRYIADAHVEVVLEK
jgi:hypothetical protein